MTTYGFRGWTLLLPALCLSFTACQASKPVCPDQPGDDRYLRGAELERALGSTPIPASSPSEVWIGSRTLAVDKLVSGPVCNDTWSGTVYVGCDVKVPAWQETPTFWKDCALEVEPGTLVYVAAHNNAAYYQGCSCHTGDLAGSPAPP